MQKKIVLIFIVFLLLGCTKKYTKNDIQKYVKTKLNLSEITILTNYEEVQEVDSNNDYHTNKIWTVLDKKNNITFHVKEEIQIVPAFEAKNNLVDDYYESVFLNYYDGLSKEKSLILDTKESSLGMNNVVLSCNYKNKAEIKECFESLKKYQKYYLNKGFNLSISTLFKCSIEKYLQYSNTILIPTNIIKLDDIGEKKQEKILLEYFKFGLLNQFDLIISDMDENDIKLVMNNNYTNKIYKLSENNTKEYYENLIASNISEISIGALYKILKFEKYNIDGSPWHYTVFTSNNDKYEFSYDFVGKEYENFIEQNYYVKNGEKVYWDTDLSISQINKIFDMNLKID